MNFNTAGFGFFLVAVFAGFWAMRRQRDARLVWLLAASWFFYACWNRWYLALIAASTLFDYWIGKQLTRPQASDRARRAWLAFSVVVNLGVLGLFKYYDFCRDNLAQLFPGLDRSLPVLDLLLPVGISFYTFQSMSYTIDLYRRQIEPARNLRDFAFYIAFFPQLVAGPIVRAADFLPQIARAPALDREALLGGLYRIMVGLTKKVLVADVLAVHIVDPVFAAQSPLAGGFVLLALYAYPLQAYADFSGYSDIAIGSARLFGFHIQENFDVPFAATSVQSFWRRWHISLSSWLRDYLYVSLGGSRRGAARTYVNLFATMAVCGAWHGANWHFVIFGVVHGAAMVVHRFWTQRRWSWVPGRLGHVLALLLMLQFTVATFVLFRAPDMVVAGDVFARILQPTAAATVPAFVWVVLVAGWCAHYLPRRTHDAVAASFVRLPAFAVGVLLSLLLGLLAWAEVGGAAFIYFQF